MTTEMDLLHMDERQRTAWLQANRVTLWVVALVWLGMIGWELAEGRAPVFLMAMVPGFALVRFVAYRWYQRVGDR